MRVSVAALKRACGATLLSLALALDAAAAWAAGGTLGPGGMTASISDYAAMPPLAAESSDPFLMIDLSVELTQQAEAYTDGNQTYPNGTVCPGRVPSGSTSSAYLPIVSTPWGKRDIGICYTAAEKYIGYFDSEKCYAYDTGDGSTTWAQQATGPYPGNGLSSSLNPPHFKPVGAANKHTCSGSFSGNFLNWATMSALDEFRSAMTGGARLIDTSGASAQTLLIRTRRLDDWGFVMKAISGSGFSFTNTGVTPNISNTFTTNPSTVTPFTSTDLAPAGTSSTGSTANCTCGTKTTCSNTRESVSSCKCATRTDKSYGSNGLYVVNDWSQISPNPGAALHRTRFYNFQVETTTSSTVKTVYSGSSVCNTVTTVDSTSSTTSAKPLSVNNVSNFNVIVQVCDPSSAAGGLEANCIKYTDGANTWYKPEGLLQKNALKMRYALTSYTSRTGDGYTVQINGGVLRSNAKYVGYQMPTSNGGIMVNPNAEVDDKGLMVKDPDKLAGKVGLNNVKPVNSGILNYINQFALYAGRYKANDPDAELYYEGLRYLMKLGPTPSFSTPPSTAGGALSATDQDGFPVFGGSAIGANTAGSPAWSDPVASSCQKNYALYVGDKNTHRQNYLPDGYQNGTLGYAFGKDDPVCGSECSDAVAKGIHTAQLENDIGKVDGGDASTNYGNEHGDGLAALAWWARTHDFRTDISGVQTLKTFVVDTQEWGGDSAMPVGTNNTLWRAAKWGGFEDTNNDLFAYGKSINNKVNTPDLDSEWNAKGATFTMGKNTVKLPDTYTLASQPANLVAGLTSAFDEALQKTAAASSAAVVANSTTGTAAFYQALYRPRTSNNNTAVTWTGLVRAFFIDDSGNFREDTDGNGMLSNGDNVIKFREDTASQSVVVDRYSVGGASIASGVSLNSLHPIWDASDQLARLSNTQVTTQRGYTATSDTGRYIFTWLDLNNNGAIDSGEIKDFTASNFPALNAASNDATQDPARLLGLDSVTGASGAALAPDKIVNYIRGADQPGYRNRTIDQGSGAQTLRLGDIVHSSPLVVGAPSLTYDTTYGDTTYRTFKSRYAKRRQVLYSGANDGMLHAFNAGFFDTASNGFYTSSDAGKGTETRHPLGGEIWAYVPYNLLPHLRWLTDSGYPHAFYVDGSPQSFDVNIFNDCVDPATCVHPYGWGTILVVGFRLGGGDVTLNDVTDQAGASDAGNRTLRSAYMVFDITDPESPPTLLGELSAPAMGYTTGKPTVVKRRVAPVGGFTALATGNSTQNQWYLVMGSGPAGTDSGSKQQALTQAVSSQVAQVFVYDLNRRQWVDADTSTTAVDGFPIAGQNRSFVGDMAAKDWNSDYTDEVIYFGTIGVGASPNNDAVGDLIRMQMPADFSFGSPTFSTLLSGNSNTPSSGQPFSAAPLAIKDSSGQPWVYAGSGRFFVTSDILTAKQMSYYGIKEPRTGNSLTFSAVAKGDLVNTTGVQVYSDGRVTAGGGGALTINNQATNTYSDLLQRVGAESGWYFNFNGLTERDVDITLPFFSSLLISAYTASNDTCDPAGSSRRVAVGQLTGTATPAAPLGEDSTTHVINVSRPLGSGLFLSAGTVKLGTGANTKWFDTGGDSDGNVLTSQLNAPSFPVYGRRMSWKELPLPPQ